MISSDIDRVIIFCAHLVGWLGAINHEIFDNLQVVRGQRNALFIVVMFLWNFEYFSA